MAARMLTPKLVCSPLTRCFLALAAALTSGLVLAASPAHGVMAGSKASSTAQAAVICPAKPAVPTPAEMKALAAQAQDRGLLWRVTDSQGDGTRASWLYGTMHVGKREWLIPGRSIVRAVQGADQLALELNLLDPEVGKALAEGLKARADAPPLAADLSQRLNRQLKLACAEDLVRLRPEAQILGLLAKTGSRQGLNAEYGVDITLAGMAYALGKPITGLEAVQTQLNELVSDDPIEIAETVDDGLKQLEDGMASRDAATAGAGLGQRQCAQAGELCRLVRLRQYRTRARPAQTHD